MKLQISKPKHSQSLYVTKSFRENGKYSSKVIEKLGTYDELLEKLGGADPIAWAKEYIAELNRAEKEQKKDIYIKYSQSVQIKNNDQRSYNGGYLFLQRIYYDLGLHEICKSISKKHKFEYDLNSIL